MKKKTSITLREEDLAKLKAIAKSEHRSLSNLIEKTLREVVLALEKKQGDKQP